MRQRTGARIEPGVGPYNGGMAHSRTTVPTKEQPEAAFAFMADGRDFATWDPGVPDGRLVAGEIVQLGVAFGRIGDRAAAGLRTVLAGERPAAS